MAGKKFKKALESYDSTKRYTVDEAVALIAKTKISSKWDETVDASIRLGVNPKYADQMVRGSVVMPGGTGKTKRVLVIAKPDKASEARKAGGHYRVIKNSLVKIAVKGSKMEPSTQLMSGTTAVIWTTGESPQPPAEIALKWAKTEPKFKLLGGYYAGSVLDVPGVEMLSKMPTKNDIRASMLMTFLAGPQSFVAQIAAPVQNFAYLLDARKRQLESA